MRLGLSGYFDSNFGDDYMMKIIVRSLPDFEFVVDGRANISQLLLSEPNVIAGSDEKGDLPALVVTGSGFMINNRGALESEMKMFLKRKNPGDFCLGCNIEPIETKLGRFLIRHKLNKFKLIVCRDKASFGWLSRNTKKPRIEFLPDILFSIPEEWLPMAGRGKKLGISLMHRAGDAEDCQYYKAMAEVADYWVEIFGEM